MKRIRGEVSNIFDPQKQQYPITNSNGEISVQFTDWHSILNNEDLIENQILVLCQSVNCHDLKDICQFFDGNMHILITLKI